MKDIEQMTDQEREELIRESKREYQNNWRRKNKEKVKKYNDDYYLKKALEKKRAEEGI